MVQDANGVRHGGAVHCRRFPAARKLRLRTVLFATTQGKGDPLGEIDWTERAISSRRTTAMTPPAVPHQSLCPCCDSKAFAAVRAATAAVLSREKEDIRLDQTFDADLRADTYEVMKVTLLLEETLGIRVPSELAVMTRRIDDLVRCVEAVLSARCSSCTMN